MRILWITPEIPIPTDNGHRFVYFNRIKEMSRMGQIIYLCAFVEDDFEFIYEDHLRKYCKDVYLFRRKKHKSNIRQLWLPNYILKRESIEFRDRVSSIINKEMIDVIIIESTNMAQYLPNKLPSIILRILSIHNIDFILLWRSALVKRNVIKKIGHFYESLKTMIYEFIIYKKNLFDTYIFVSEYEKCYISRKFRKIKVFLSPIGVNDIASSFNHIADCNTNVILFLGNLSYFCNIDAIDWFVNKIYPIICSSLNNVILNIVGKQPSDAVLLLKKSSDRINIISDVLDIGPILAEADLVIAPIISGGGVKVKVLNALSAKKLVVSTKMGIEGTSLQDRKHLFVVDDFNHNEFAFKCIECLVNKDSLLPIANEGYKYILNEYRWGIVSKNLLSYIDLALNQKRGKTNVY